jgi:hypothetical protein
MQVVACNAPLGSLEPAPLTSLPMDDEMGKMQLRAFWGEDDAYFVQACAGGDVGADVQWYRIDAGEVLPTGTLEERMEIARLLSDITPIGGGRVAFPIGSTGRRFYRVWRTGSSDKGSRTKILAVRAARSRRLPA